ncbi:hypothetical protein DRE_01080 [Drechslerella stenobrocha 248]|uniref:DUF6594 domain-containing protein n=1 Tax=Drechslerella stenobrocha 248 TaxID=1043628 RepID=W7HMC0_9PEZI|nr:hypothetical protein DRE_01080 [Drechslerella stenobrocha 248]
MGEAEEVPPPMWPSPQPHSTEHANHHGEGSSNTNCVRNIDLVSTGDDGVTLHTRIVELSPPDPITNDSLVAVIRQGYPPYLAQLDTTAPDLQELAEALDPSHLNSTSISPPGKAMHAMPCLLKIDKLPFTISEGSSDHGGSKDEFEHNQEGFSLVAPTNRMMRVPLREPPASRGPDEDAQSGAGYSKSRDPEKDAPMKNPTFAPGYPSTAAIISTDAEMSVYRRFDRLNARNILYYQAELMYIESEMDKLDEEDRLNGDTAAGSHLRHFKDLWENYQDDRVMKRKGLIQDMRYLLKEYNKCISVYKQLMDCPEPSNRVLTSIRNWRSNQGNPPINDISEQAYEKPYEADLMALKPPKCDDPLSIFVQDNLGRFFKKPQPMQIPNSDNVLYYSERAIDLFVTIICTLLAIVVLVGSMTTLFFVESQGLRLGLVWLFTFLFAVSIFLMARLSKGEIFLATAA